MTGCGTLLGLIAPVFLLIAAGVIARRIGWLGTEADASLLKLVVNLFYPCLVFGAVVFPMVMAKHYNGHPLTAAQVVTGTTAIAIFLIPLWIDAGLAFVGV